MARKQAKRCRFFGSRTSRSVTSNLPSGDSQGPSQPSADTPSTTTPDNTDRKLLSRLGHLFHQSNNTRSDPLATETTDNSIGGQVKAAQQAMDDMKSIPQALQTTIGLVGQADAAGATIQSIEAILRPLKLFNSFVTNLSNVHPYVQFALGILTAASQLLIDQANLDSEVFGLLNTVKDLYEFLMEKDTLENIDSMKETLRKISQEMSATALFVVKYCKKQTFLVRMGDRLVSDPQTVAQGHIKNLGDLMQQYRDRTMRDIQINMYHVREDLNLEGMAYAAGAGLNTTKKCLDGTRREILKDITHWITSRDVNAPRILWLHGQAGRGKSAIAHTIGSLIQDMGVPGACFCFAHDRQSERREEKILTTIARDLADREPAYRRALSNIVANNLALKTTCDVVQQWKQFILQPLSKISGEIVGNVVVIIDALDESGPDTSRRDVLRLLTSADAAGLPTNFRILLTSRPLPDIVRAVAAAPHVKATSLDDIPWEWVERDIKLFVSKGLEGLPGIGVEEVQNVVNKSDGLFEWARVACEFIKPNKAGATPKENYDDLMALEAEEGRTLLDATYFTILEAGIPQTGTRFKRYRSVMRQVVMTLEPLPMAALNCMRESFPNKQDHYDISLILEFMSPVLGGVVDRSSPVRPLHASFYDFLMDPSRSGDYSINISDAKDLAFSTLRILRDNLQFNICELESSYLANREVSDLAERINKKIPHHLSYSCQFWAQHLEKTDLDLGLAGQVRDIVGSEKILFWMEILSLLGRVGKGLNALASVRRWLLKGNSDFEDTLTLAEDGIKFIENFSSLMLYSTPHLYVSALPFIPSNALLSAMVMPKLQCSARIHVGGLKTWPLAQLLLQGHTSHVMSVGFSPDGKRIVSGSWDNTVRLWDVEGGMQIGSPLQGHTSKVTSVGFSPDGKRIVTGSEDMTVRVWSVEGGVQIGSPLHGHTREVTSIGFSLDGKRIVSGSLDKTVRVWDVEGGVQVGSPLQGHTSYVTSVGFSPDGKRIVSGSWDNTVRVWDVEGGMQIGSPLQGHTEDVTSVGFSPDGKRIVSGSLDETVRVWDVEGGVQIGSPLQDHTAWVTSVGFSPDGKRIVSGSLDKTVRVWDVEGGVQIGSPLQGHTREVTSVGFSPDGKRIVSASRDNTVRVWDVEGGVQIGSPLQGHTSGVTSVGFSPDGKRIVTGSEDKTVRVCDVEEGVQIGSPLHGHTLFVNSVAFSPDGKRIVLGSRDDTVRVWDVEGGVQIGSPLQGHTLFVTSVGFSPDGKRIVSGSWDKTVRVWDAEGGVLIGSPLEGHTSYVTSVGFSPDRKIVSGSRDNTVRVWDVEGGVQIGSPLQGHTREVTSVGFSPDGKRIVSGSEDKSVRVWDVEGGVQVGSPLQGHTSRVTSVGFSPDGKRIVSGSEDMTVRVWDVEGGVQIGSPLQGHTEIVTSVGFSPDGKRIVSGSGDKTARVWDVVGCVQIGHPLEGHTRDVTSAASSPDGEKNASGTQDRNVSIWDSPTYQDGISKKLDLVASISHSGFATSHPADGVKGYHICFSPHPSHALPNSDWLVHRVGLNDTMLMQPVKLQPDGWIRGPRGELLLWIPPALRNPFYSMRTIVVISRGCCVELDLSQMAHGREWWKCFKTAV